MGDAMRFTFPLILAAIPPFAIFVLLTLRKKQSRTLKGFLAALLRVLSASAVLGALAGPFTSLDQLPEAIPVLVDVSSSVGAGQGDALLKRARKLGSELGVSLALIPFGKSALPQRADSGQDFATLRRASESADSGVSDLGQALTRLAIDASPPPAALLLSDGYETAGSASTAASLLGSTTRVFPLTEPGESQEPALRVSQLYVPLTVKAKKAAEIRATVSSAATEPLSAELELKHGDSVLLKRTVSLEPGKDLLVPTQSNPEVEGLNVVTATLAWRDSEGNHTVTRTAWLNSERRNRVLLLSGSYDDHRILPQILKNQAYELDARISDPDTSAEQLSKYRVVVINNAPLDGLPPSLVRALPEYVRGGGGLVMIGGNKSFGLGGYIGSEIEPILPVELVPPRTEKKRLNIAVQLVIDKSRSMADGSRLEFAKSAAREVVSTLKDEDYIGVIGFEDVAFVALPLTRVSEARRIASDRISRLFPTNGTNLYPAMEEARRGLSRVTAGRKHLIVLTDGQIPDQGPIYFNLIHQLRTLGVTVSTVLVGSNAPDAFMTTMAQLGGGSFYHTDDPRNLPKIFLSDLKIATGERTLIENPEIPVLVGPSGVRSTGIRSFPFLRGYVETLEKPAANTELVVPEEDRRFPLLASWKVGAGKSIAFTSDANGRWSAPWMAWDEVQEFWSNIVESAQPENVSKSPTPEFDLRTWVEGGTLIMDLAVFEDTGATSVTALLKTPQGEEREVTFSPRQRGHYRSELPEATAGTYRSIISLGNLPLPEVAWTLSGELFGEQPKRAPNLQVLESVASKTGGRLNPSAADLKPLLTQGTKSRDLSLEFLAAALLLFFAELAVRAARLRGRKKQRLAAAA